MATEKRLIYMDDTMDKLRAYAERKHAAGHIELANGILKAVNYIRNNISRVDAVEVVHGRWVHGHDLLYCSRCGCEIGIRDDFNYCPNCGANMDGGADNG